MGLRSEGTDADALAGLGSREAILDTLLGVAEERLAEREQEYGAETWALVERAILLRAIDSLWVEHLTELDDFRRGVGLRGYAGTDPLVEFKREAFKLYEELRGFIRHQVASTIFRVSVQRRPAATETTAMPTLTPAQLEALRAGSPAGAAAQPSAGSAATPGAPEASAAAVLGSSVTASSAAGARAEIVPQARPAVARPLRLQHGDETVGVSSAAGGRAGEPADAHKIGRNDPCWCGSGKKYKRCHGS
jgi:preprotein translocase subunit SecA